MLLPPKGLLLIFLILGLQLFGRGFFLTRLELRGVSREFDLRFSPLAISGVDELHENSISSAWGLSHAPPFRRVVIVVIDALRYDFAAERMPQLGKLLALQPDHARIYRGIADAPTVTMQRLKGFTTGSLPTFLDLSSNFAASAISEDNIVDQAAAAARSELVSMVSANTTAPPLCPLQFFGDDTWAALFPAQFTLSRPFPSFDVVDLHGVDNGVKLHLVPAVRTAAAAWAELGNNRTVLHKPSCTENSDFRLLVAHFLGVDHVGHRYSPSHPLMRAKLDEMDIVLVQLIEVRARLLHQGCEL